MPERINAVHQQPSPHIVFIKSLPGPDSKYAQDFLERIAAICHPIMKAHHLRIMTLEEHEPNREFIGRNFNAGEIIQLVLKARNTGVWLSFRTVQMVMMHELAHCLQMNHGREFWKVNTGFKGELKTLWQKGYTGEGLWGRGRTLLSGEYDRGSRAEDEVLPAQLCGGAFRSRRRRRRRRNTNGPSSLPEESNAEKKRRRIEKKFGVNGVALGGNEETRVKLEYGQKVKGNPRVANSSRGRELRVAAALARFGEQKVEEEQKEDAKTKVDISFGDTIGTDDEYEDAEDGPRALDLDGSEIKDSQGLSMIRVCEGEDQNDSDVKQEMEELRDLDVVHFDESSNHQMDAISTSTNGVEAAGKGSRIPPIQSSVPTVPTSSDLLDSAEAGGALVQNGNHSSQLTSCPICSMANEPAAMLCVACSHVLDTKKITKHWRCQSDACKESQYINSADNSLCGVCGARRLADSEERD